jgi:hypothetical protein
MLQILFYRLLNFPILRLTSPKLLINYILVVILVKQVDTSMYAGNRVFNLTCGERPQEPLHELFQLQADN